MTALPSGTLTFLFTDIEGSTRLWEEQPEAMGPALARHDSLLRTVLEQHQGVVFKTVGDAFCAAFVTASDAIDAALTAQQALIAVKWPEPLSLAVRMALHTGTAELRDNDYFGQTLNRLSRLLAAGHGGQVLISAATQELVRDTLAEPVSLKAMGEHRLRDLSRPETIFQLLHPALPSEFPPLKSLTNPGLPNNLPLQLTSFIGREREVVEIKSLIEKTRLLTLTGSGGCGKTRLALQVAADLLEKFPDGVWLVEFASLADSALVPQTVAQALGVKEIPGLPIQSSLIESLKSKRLLLLLDNCEHVVADCARLTSDLLRSCPGIKVLATSLQPLGVPGELTYRTPSLSCPDTKQPLAWQRLAQYEAVRLFIERAQSHRPDLTVGESNAPALAQLCQRLDGIPLALELAASRVRTLSLDNINSRLHDRFRLLTGGDRTVLPRQQTLRALIDWSYDLLNAREKLTLARLAVFAGGWTLEAAETVAAGACATEPGIEEWEVLDLLTSLVDKSLVYVEEQDGLVRYGMLETVRHYAVEKLNERGEAEAARARHRDWCLDLAEEADPQLKGPDQGLWLRRLEAEHDNLRAALLWSVEGTGRAELACALWQFWYRHGHLREGRAWLEGTLAHPAALPDPLRAKALYGAGVLARHQGDFPEAHRFLDESIALYRALGDQRGIADAQLSLGMVLRDQGDQKQAAHYYEQCLAVYRELGDPIQIGLALNNLGGIALPLGEFERARTLYEESLNFFRDNGYLHGVSATLYNLGETCYRLGDFQAAETMFKETVILYWDLGNRGILAFPLGGLAKIAKELHQYERAAVLFGVAEAIRETVGAPMPPSDRVEYDRHVDSVRQRLGGERFHTDERRGRQMALDAAISYALDQTE